MFGFFRHVASPGVAVGIFLTACFISAGAGQEAGIPPSILKELAAEKFAERETAQTRLVEWATKHPKKSVELLLKEIAEQEDPEVRSRCRNALKAFVLAREYRRDGFLGINMMEVEVKLPGDPQPARAIQVTTVMKNSAVEAAGIPEGSLIVGLGGKVWRVPGMAQEFPAQIRKTGPGGVVVLQLLENGKIVDKEVTLRERPVRILDAWGDDLEKVNEEERERYFQQWLDKRRKQSR